MTCHHSIDAGPWLLGALDDLEAERFAEHAAGCRHCTAEVEHLSPAAAALPMAAEQLAPPPALKARIMAEVEREAELLRAAGPEADRVPSGAPARRFFGLWPLSAMPALALACALLLVGLVGGALVARDDAPETHVTQAKVTGPGRVSLVVAGRHGQLRLDGVRQPPKGSVYQVWLVPRGAKAPVPSRTLFNVRRDGTARVDIQEDVAGVDQVLVTVEPDGGSTSPTNAPTIVADPT